MPRSLLHRALRPVLVGFCALIAVSIPRTAGAHFILEEPMSWQSQDELGLPQKLGPCGNESGGTPTGVVTPYEAGQTINITVDEVITHPGHYRIALAVNDPGELPPEPTVTPNNTPCGTVPIDPSPTFPVLADGVFQHTTAFTAPQTTQITLPSNVTCSHCTLQVIEFMSDHALNNPGGCFYHHCANISIAPPGSAKATTKHAGCTSLQPDWSGLAMVAWLLRRRRRMRLPGRNLIARRVADCSSI